MTLAALVAREESGAHESARALSAKGHHALAAPVSRVQLLPRAVPQAGVQALAFTSRHGVKAFVAANAWRDIPAFAVGPATAQALRDAGFKEVLTAGGEGMALVNMLRVELSTIAGEVLHVGGDRLSVDVAAQMQLNGFRARHLPMYRTRALSSLPSEALALLRAGRVGSILFYSADGARVLGVLVETGGCGAQARAARALCLSPSVEQSARIWGWSQTASAPEASETSLFTLLETG